MRVINLISCLVFLPAFCILSSCGNTSYSPAVEAALNAAGDNRSELVKVLKHYSRSPEDSLKLKAAYYLIGGLPGHFYYDGNQLRHYLDYSMLVKRDGWHGEYIMNSIRQIYGAYSMDSLRKVQQAQAVKADSLIRSIDLAYGIWMRQPWSKHYPFKIFCEYVLPYFIEDEIPLFDKEKIFRQFDPLLDSIRRVGGSAIDAAFVVNEKLKADGFIYSLRQSFMPHLGAGQVVEYRVGSCREMADLATYVMRSLGIPVGNDFLPQWPQRSLGHNWNVVFDTTGKSVMFLGTEDSPGVPHFEGTKKGKVFRYMLYANPGSLGMQCDSDEAIPVDLSSPFIEDVTDRYATCSDIKIPLMPMKDAKHAYLALFNNTSWVPVDWASLENGEGVWKKVERDIVYLPVYFTRAGLVPAAAPVEVGQDGGFHYLKPDKLKPIKRIECTMVFPLTPQFVDQNSMLGGRMQGANKPDFMDAVDLYVITARRKPALYWNGIRVTDTHKFRYLRFYGGRGWQHDCNISELAAYSDRVKLGGKVFSPKKEVADDPFGAEKAVDGDLNTTFLADGSSKYKAWVGLDFGKPVAIDSIRFAAGLHTKGPEMFVVPGHTYQLVVWDNGQWNLVATKKAAGNKLFFEQVPSNGLYLLHDSSARRDERIFTYENNAIRWF